MGARNGVTAAIMAQMGFTGVWDVLDGEHNALIALSTEPRPEEMVAGLGSRFFVTETAIKLFSVGYPIQAPLDAFLTLLREHKLSVDKVERSGRVEVTLRNGQTISHFTRHPPGTKENPLNTERVNEKAWSLMTPVLGAERTEVVIRRVNALEKLNEVHELRPLLAS
jgi:2-methylcitrate dehydratase PrpD